MILRRSPRIEGGMADVNPTPAFQVDLKVDGESTSLKPFIQDMLGGGIVGLVEGLKDVENPHLVEIRIERSRESSDS